MPSKRVGISLLLVLLLLSYSTLSYAHAFQNGENASIVLGQTNYTSDNVSSTQSGLGNPDAITFDSSGNLWVAATANNRVLEFLPPFCTGENANITIGQPSFTALINSNCVQSSPAAICGPTALAFDPSGNLWVVDKNYEIIEIKPPFNTGMGSSFIFSGGNGSEVNQSSFQAVGVSFDASGNMWVVDSNPNANAPSDRVLEFKPPFANGENALLEIGQANFTSDNETATTQSLLSSPQAIAFDSSGNLWVADNANYRVLEFTTPFSNGESASVVIGESDFTSFSGNGPTQSVLDGPYGVAFDHGGNLWVVDDTANRVLEFSPPFANGENAAAVVGEPDYNSSNIDSNVTQSLLLSPSSIAFDKAGNLWVADTSNSRVLEFQNLGTQTTASSSSADTITTASSTTSSAPPPITSLTIGGIPLLYVAIIGAAVAVGIGVSLFLRKR